MNIKIIEGNILRVINQPCKENPWNDMCTTLKSNGLSKDGKYIMLQTKPEDSSTRIEVDGDFVATILKELPEKYREHLVTIEHDTWIGYSYVPVFDSDTQSEWNKEHDEYISEKQKWCDKNGCE